MNLEGEVGYAVQKRTTEDFTYAPSVIKVVDRYEPLFVLLSNFWAKSIIFNYYIFMYEMIKKQKNIYYQNKFFDIKTWKYFNTESEIFI